MLAHQDRSPFSAGLLLATLATLAASSACATSSSGAPRNYGSAEILHRLQPGDIAVAPLRNQSGNPDLPHELLRESLSKALLARLYSPLDLGYVDGNWIESSFRGTPAPDALLVIVVNRWDTDDLFTTGGIEAGADLFLFEGGATTGTLLWASNTQTTIDMRRGRATPPGPSPHLIPEAAELFAAKALESLPVRDPLAAHP